MTGGPLLPFLPATAGQAAHTAELAAHVAEACRAWLAKSPSRDTRSNYDRDIRQFLAFAGIAADQPERKIVREGPHGPEEIAVPVGTRDRAIFAILAYTGCRVGELVRLKVGSYKSNGVHKVLEIHGKGGKERQVPLHKEAEERLEAWLDASGIRQDLTGAMFRPVLAARGQGKQGFAPRPMTRRAVQKLVEAYVRRLQLDPNVTVHSFRVTALTTARERGSDIIDLQDYAGHADPRTTLAYIRNRDKLTESPAYVLKY